MSVKRTKLLKNYMIVTFTRDRMVLDALAEYFCVIEGVTIVDLLGMQEDLARKFISAYSIDIAFIENEVVENSRDGILREIISMEEAKSTSGKTHFVIRYDQECFEEMERLGNTLLKKRLPVTQCRLDEKEDCEILAQTMHGIINGREQAERVRMECLR